MTGPKTSTIPAMKLLGHITANAEYFFFYIPWKLIKWHDTIQIPDEEKKYPNPTNENGKATLDSFRPYLRAGAAKDVLHALGTGLGEEELLQMRGGVGAGGLHHVRVLIAAANTFFIPSFCTSSDHFGHNFTLLSTLWKKPSILPGKKILLYHQC